MDADSKFSDQMAGLKSEVKSLQLELQKHYQRHKIGVSNKNRRKQPENRRTRAKTSDMHKLPNINNRKESLVEKMCSGKINDRESWMSLLNNLKEPEFVKKVANHDKSIDVKAHVPQVELFPELIVGRRKQFDANYKFIKKTRCKSKELINWNFT